MSTPMQRVTRAVHSSSSCLLDLALLKRTHEGILLFVGLEATVSKLAGSVNELEVDLLQSLSLGLNQQRLSESDDAFLGAHAAATYHDKVIVHLTVVNKASHRSDRLLCDVMIRRTVVLDHLAVLRVHSLSNAVDLLVDLRAVMVTLLTGTRHRK